MTAPFRIAHLPETSSKEQELAHLRLLAQTAEPGTFVRTLLSAELITWFAGAIKDDGVTDLHGLLDWKTRELAAEIGKTRDLAARVIEETEKAELMTRLEADKTRQLNDALDGWGRERQSAARRCAELEVNLADAHNRADAAELEVLKLKAKLYDLTSAGK